VRALTFMRDAIRADGWVPASVLAWQEEQVRFAFQNGNAAFMRNWPYAAPLLDDASQSAVAGRFAVAPFPADAGLAAAALGGSHLAVSAWSENPGMAMELVRFLTAPEQMLERARVASQLPARRSLYQTDELAGAMPVPIDQLRRLVDAAVARPATPVYSELSEILQVRIHRALSGQQSPADALRDAAREARTLLARTGLGVAPSPS
jgi:multiple sugar transport system substrate-binding protein